MQVIFCNFAQRIKELKDGRQESNSARWKGRKCR